MSIEEVRDMCFIRDEIKELISKYKFEIAKIVLLDENLDKETEDDIVFCSINEFIPLEKFTGDEIEFAIDSVEEACYKMAHFMHTLKNE